MPCIEKIYEKITVGNTSYSVDNDNEPYFCPHELADFTELIYFFEERMQQEDGERRKNG